MKFPSNQVIKGWQEGLQRMSAGSKATMVIPSDLAYGDTGRSGAEWYIVLSAVLWQPCAWICAHLHHLASRRDTRHSG